jgi:hypothetical protein
MFLLLQAISIWTGFEGKFYFTVLGKLFFKIVRLFSCKTFFLLFLLYLKGQITFDLG